MSSIVRDIPEQRAKELPAALLGTIYTPDRSPLGGVAVRLASLNDRFTLGPFVSTSEGVVRIPRILPGHYAITFQVQSYTCMAQNDVVLNPGEVLVIEVTLRPNAGPADARVVPESTQGTTEIQPSDYVEKLRRPVAEIQDLVSPPRPDEYQSAQPDRWDIYFSLNNHWWDPYNQNRIKGDKPVVRGGKVPWGQSIFFNFTGTSSTAFDGRRLFVPSGVSAANPGSSQFFGRGGQVLVEETVRLSFDLFSGDTSFKPMDWRIKVTPAFNVNQLWAREQGVVNIDVREGTSRTDGHVGLQEAFVEKRLHNFGPNYDFLSVRAGIQQFSSDFRGLLFTQEQPGLRVFGNLRSNRLQYNAAYFFFLEKDTNSGLNTLRSRHQQVFLANFYWQDSFFKGYTTQFSYHYNKDDASRHFDENGFLVRPAPIGIFQPHDIRVNYLGWTSNGHIGRLNVSHAIYEALGYDERNLIANRRTDINAQLAALELSLDQDWLRLHLSGLFASGDATPRDGTARGFDAISEAQEFAGAPFSFFNREGIRLTGTGVALTAPDSFLPNLRSSKEEGQASFVNPGIILVNAGVDCNVTTTIRAVANASYMRFNHTEPLQLLLFQPHIDQNIGVDYSVGVVYRPAFNENVIFTGGVSALTPGTGLRQIYTGKTLVSAFTIVQFKF